MSRPTTTSYSSRFFKSSHCRTDFNLVTLLHGNEEDPSGGGNLVLPALRLRWSAYPCSMRANRFVSKVEVGSFVLM